MHNTQPLSWPAGWERTRSKDREPSRFGRGADLVVLDEQEKLLKQVALLRAKAIKISTNLVLKANGQPKVQQPEHKNPGVAVCFEFGELKIVLACDKWPIVEENIDALRAHINAMHGMDQWGVGKLEQVFRRYPALSPPDNADWRELLSHPASLTEAETTYRAAMRSAHPDNGGISAEAARLNTPIEQARVFFTAAGN